MSSRRGSVVSVSCNDVYSFTKPVRDEIVLVAGIGVEGDVHAGVRVKHRARVKADPTQPNLRQVHLIQAELFGEVGEKGYAVAPGNLGENVTTGGIDLLALPLGTILRFGPPAGDPLAGDLPAGETPGPDADERKTPATAVDAVLAAAAAAVLDGPTAKATAAVATAAARETGDDPRPAVVIAGLRNPCAQINDFQQGLLKEVVGHDANGSLVRKAGIMAVVLVGGPIRAGDHVHVEFPPQPHGPLARV